MTIRTKLILSFSIVACVPLVGGAIGLLAHRSSQHRLEQTMDIAQQGQTLIRASQEIATVVATEREDWLGSLGPKAIGEGRALDLAPHLAKIRSHVSAVELLRARFAVDARYLAAVSATQENLAAHAQTGALTVTDFDRAKAAAGELVDAAYKNSADALLTDEKKYSNESDLYDAIMSIGTLVGVALGILFGILMSLAVIRHIGEVARKMWDETCNVADAAARVAASSRDLASASSQQAASLEETSSSLNEVNSMVKANANHANEVRTISHENRLTSDRSATEIADLQTAMQEMALANGNIAKIVQSIDEIAFQTNILALNAAVEAARAGESGAGFAVVAEEVRSLAQRSAGAARETGAKIEDALKKSQRGAEMAGQVEKSLRKVIDDNRRVDDIVARIAEASAEQAKGLDLAVNSMARIDQLTQSNTASAESTAEAAQLLDEESRGLKQELSVLMDSRTAGESGPADRARLHSAAKATQPLAHVTT